MANTVRVVVTAKDNATKVLQGVGKKAGIALAALGAASAAAAVVSGKAFGDFERQMNEVYTLLPGISDRAMGDMESQVKDFSREFGVLPKDVIPALYQALSAGVPQGNVFDFLETAQKTAKGGVTDLTTAVSGLTTGISAFSLGVEGSARVSDALFTGMKLGKTTVGELSNSLSDVAPIGSALGITVEELVASMAALTLGGVDTAQAATQVRAAMVAMVKPNADMVKAFQAAGYESGQAAIEQLGMAGAMKIVADAAGGSVGKLTKMTGRVEGANAILAITGAQAESFAGILGEMGQATGATEAAFDQMDQGLDASMDRVKANIEILKITVGEHLAPAFAAMLDVIIQDVIPGLERFADWFNEEAKPQIAEFMRWLQLEFGKFQEYYREEIQPALDNIMIAVTALVDWFRAHWPEIWTVVEPVVNQVIAALDLVWTTVFNVVGLILNIIAGDWAGAWNNAKAIFGGFATYIEETLHNLLDFLQAVARLAWDGAQDLGTAIGQGIMTGITNIWDSVISWLKDKLNQLLDVGIDIPGIGKVSIGSIGGVISGGFNTVGGIAGDLGIGGFGKTGKAGKFGTFGGIGFVGGGAASTTVNNFTFNGFIGDEQAVADAVNATNSRGLQ